MSSLTQKIPSLRNYDLKGKVVFLRVDFNVPIKDEVIQNDFRIQATLPTIKWILDHKATLILATHLGRPKGKFDPLYSVKPIASHLSELIQKEVIVTEDPVNHNMPYLLKTINPEQQIVFLENLRFTPWETENNVKFAEDVASYCDIYVNDAFGACHRAHASVFSFPQKIKKVAMGFLLEKEILELEALAEGKKKPFAIILGGSKVEDKIPLLENLCDKADSILIGGGMAYTFLKAQNKNVGRSLVDKNSISFAKNFLQRMKARGKKVLLPCDHKVAPVLSSSDCETVTEIPDNMIAADIGPETLKLFQKHLQRMNLIFWNGPMGVFENPAFKEGSLGIAQMLSQSEAHTVVGGGDSVSALHEFNLQDSINHISTGGGASLDFLKGEEPVGIRALRKVFF